MAVLLGVLFIAGAFLIVQPAFQSDDAGGGVLLEESESPGSQSSENDDGSDGDDNAGGEDGSSPDGGNGGGDSKPVTSWRIGGATVDNQYPVENFSQGTTGGSSCAVLENVSPSLPITVVSVSVGPAGVWRALDCSPQLPTAGSPLTGAVPCAAGVVLKPRQEPRRGCWVGVGLLVTGRHAGTVTLTTRARCTSRDVAPCSRLPGHLTPTEAHPITLTVVQKIGFTGSDATNPIGGQTPESSPESSPSPDTETSPESSPDTQPSSSNEPTTDSEPTSDSESGAATGTGEPVA